MNVCILLGSPHPEGNTSPLSRSFGDTLHKNGCAVSALALYNLDLRPCIGCRSCQKTHTGFGCPQPDDMHLVFDAVMDCDLLVLASPIYSWYCTPPMKMVLDRLVYGMNKFYGEEKGPCLWEGKALALITTCGYPIEKGAALWEEGVRRYANHSRLRYLGMLAGRHMGYDVPYMDKEKMAHARAFAESLLEQMNRQPQSGQNG